MNAPETTEGREPEFVRLWLPELELWVVDYSLIGGSVTVLLVKDFARARVFVSRPAGDLEAITSRLNACIETPATFDEWIADEQPHECTLAFL